MNTPNNKYGLRSSNENEVSSFNVPEVLYNNRYCNQDDFNIIICGGRMHKKVLRKCIQINPSNFARTRNLPSMLEKRCSCQSVAINSDIFVAGTYTSKFVPINSAEMFSHKNKMWKNIDLPFNGL